MEIKTVVCGYLKENCYVVTKDDKTIIIDPGDEASKIIDACHGKSVVGILLTHRHFDHVGALKEIEDAFGIECSSSVKDFPCEIISTPGHTSDSVSYYFEDDHVLFSGDFLFKGTIGRMDLPTGSVEDMKKSLAKISTYPEDTTVYPGHGSITVLKDEIPYFEYYLNS